MHYHDTSDANGGAAGCCWVVPGRGVNVIVAGPQQHVRPGRLALTIELQHWNSCHVDAAAAAASASL
jgi:hypothetical protein